MDFSENIKQSASNLIKKAKVLPQINIQWETPIIVNCAELTSKDTLTKNKVLDVFEKNKNHPAIYYFEIKSSHTGTSAVGSLLDFKNMSQRSCPKIDGRSRDSKYLYCGSRKEGLHGRFIQHLGFGSPNTYALQLFYWAKKMKLILEFNYAWLDKEHINFTELLESALADKLKPLVGKTAK